MVDCNIHGSILDVFRHLMDHTMMFCASDPGIIYYPVFTHLQARYEEGSYPHVKSASDLDCFSNQSVHIGPDSDVGPHEQGFGYSMSLLDYFMGGCAGCLGTEFSALGDRLQICTNDECGAFGSIRTDEEPVTTVTLPARRPRISIVDV